MTQDRITATVLLGGTDITDHVDFERLVKAESALNEELDTCELTLVRISELSATILRGWQELVVLNGSDKVFGGFVLNKNKKPARNSALNDLILSASDYAAYLEKVYINREFLNMTDAEIIAEVFTDPDLADYDGETYVAVIRTIPRVVCNRWSVRELLNWLVEQNGGYWYVDYDKRVHMFGTIENRAPFDVTMDTTDSTRERAENVEVNEDAAGVVNVVEVIGGNALNGDKTFKYTKAGYGVELQLDKRLAPWTGASKIVVRRNDGGATTNLVTNPSFEVNITDGWTQYQAGSGAAWTQDSTKYVQGVKSAKIKAGTALSMLRGASITLLPGEPLSAQAMVWTSEAGMASLVIYDVSNSLVLAEIANRKTSSWETLSITYFNSSASNMTVRVELRNNAVDSTQLVYFDGVQAEKLGWPSAYCDGSLGAGYAWSGTANNSTSTRVNMPVWTTLTVKDGNKSELESRDEVLYYDDVSRLEQELNWNLLADGIEIDGQEERPVRAIVRNYASYEYFSKWMTEVITDTTIIDPTVARIRGATELAKYAAEIETATFEVRRSGLQAGQTINVYLPHRGLDGDYLIRRVSTSFGIGGYLVAKVSIGALDRDLTMLLLNLSRRNKAESEYSVSEVREEILDARDVIRVADGGGVVSGSSGPYLYDTGLADYSTYGPD